MPHSTTPSPRVAFVGLGAMGFGMASHLVKAGYSVRGFDMVPAQLEAFQELGGIPATSPREAVEHCSVLIVVVANNSQADSVFFDAEKGAVANLPQNATIVLCATVPPSYHGSVQDKLASVNRSDVNVIDAPISGGAAKAALGQLTILTAGSAEARGSDSGVVAAMAEKVYYIPGGLGSASTVKMINQLLAGVHIAAAAEAMSFAAKMGLNTQMVFDTVNTSSSWSWMFENRVEHMLRDDWTPKSALDIFVKDMGIVTSTAQTVEFPAPLSAAAEQLYVAATSNGLGRQDDAGLARFYLPVQTPSRIRDLTTAESSPEAQGRMQTVLDLLEGIHLVAAAEAIALAARCGLDTKSTYEIISNAAGTSRLFESRGLEMVNQRFESGRSVSSAAEKLAKAVTEARTFKAASYLASAALQVLQFAKLSGLADHGDSSVIKVWDALGAAVVSAANGTEANGTEANGTEASGTEAASFVPRNYPPLPLKATISALPMEYTKDVLPQIRDRIQMASIPVLVALDDDPTGTQTCHGINVLTIWTVEALAEELSSGTPGFFVLTNSRALGPDHARALLNEICSNLKQAGEQTGKQYEIVLRGDSTLRGHFPLEVEVAASATFEPDGWILAPFFFQGGRYTINDVHYVAEGTDLVPAGNTQFAADKTFGYRSSNLEDYVAEKAGFEKSTTCVGIGIDDIRLGGPEKVAEILLTVSNQSVVIVNSAAESDMNVFCLGLLMARAKGKSFLYRTGAAFVSSRLGIEQIPPLRPEDVSTDYERVKTGGLIVAGSYVPKTTQQLDSLRRRRGNELHTIELDVETLVSKPGRASEISKAAAEEASRVLELGKDVLIMSSRKLVSGKDGASSLSIGTLVAQILVDIVELIQVRPRYLIAKGGITSSDAATKSLKIKKAAIVGQGIPGCPMWQSQEVGARWPGIPFLVFPGNVGGEDALGEVVEKWAMEPVS